MKILFFIGTLSSGGKERRLIELLSYFKKKSNYSLIVVVRKDKIDYPAFVNLDIPYIILTEKYKQGDKTLHYKFYKICKEHKPDIVHAWGSMPAFVSLLAIIRLKIPLINSQITDSPPNIRTLSFKNIINIINFRFSTVILANSKAGLKAYNAKSRKSMVIYNGLNLDRFAGLYDAQLMRTKYGIITTYVVIMVASFSDNKDYDRFVEIVLHLNTKRSDVTYLAVGDGIHLERLKKIVSDDRINNFKFTGKIDHVEHLINIADIGLLFSNKLVHGEGISNAIMEYMALGKPVIANDAGGTKEIVKNDKNGYLITDETTVEIAYLINDLLDNKEKRQRMGENGRRLIHESFTIDRMGEEFERVYKYMVAFDEE